MYWIYCRCQHRAYGTFIMNRPCMYGKFIKNSDLLTSGGRFLLEFCCRCHESVMRLSFWCHSSASSLWSRNFSIDVSSRAVAGSIDVSTTPVRALSRQKVCVKFSIGACDFSVHLCHFSVGEPGASVILCNSVKISTICQHLIWRYTQYSTCCRSAFPYCIFCFQ